ncbi:hypothetical protein QQ045_032898 [Rhodiola kirilowii]
MVCELVIDFNRDGSLLGKLDLVGRTLPRLVELPRDVDGIKVEPYPYWSLDELFQELELKSFKLSSSPLKRNVSGERSAGKQGGCFHMRVFDEEFDSDEENHDRSSITTRRFGCDDLYLSDSEDENDLALQDHSHLMKRVELVQGALLELTHEHDLQLKEVVRSQVTAFAITLLDEYKKNSTAFIHIRKYRDARRDLERRFDTQYNRKIAQDLDSRLTIIKHEYELKSLIEERKIRSDAAFEEAKRKEKALQLEKLRQEKAKAEAEDKRRVAEDAKFAALEAEKMDAKEAAEKEANDQRLILEATKKHTNVQGVNLNQSKATTSDGSKKTISADDLVKAAESSIKAEKERLQKLEELCELNSRLIMSSQQDFSSQEKKIARVVRQITGTIDSVTKKSTEFIKILNDHQYPHSISLAAFAEKIVSHSYHFASTAFATGHVLVLVTSQVPHVMDIILAELHKACVYTVPKHISYSKSVFDSRESYLKILGYQEVDGKLECGEDFLIRVESCLKLYGALIQYLWYSMQTQVDGILNPHGLEAGWTWLATVLNNLPACIYTAVALETFLKMAGFALYKKYKGQFIKLLEVISEHFLKSLREGKEPGAGCYIVRIQSYIKDEKFLQEPEGWRLQGKLLSSSRC